MRKDWLYHFIAGFVISSGIGAFFYPAWGLIAGTGAGLGKELIYDMIIKKGPASPADFAFTWFGASVGCTLMFLIRYK